MASRTLDVRINVTDNASATFSKVGNSAKTMADGIEEASQAGDGFDGLVQQLQSLDSEITTAGRALTGFGVATTAAVGLGVRNFANLESAMANVNSIAGLTENQLGSMTDQVRNLSVELGVSPTGLAEGLYDIVSSGIDAADAMDVLEVSAIAARAGLTDTATSVKAITAVLNAYGLEAEDAGEISDVLFTAVDSGVISFEELASSLGRTLPLASSLTVSIEELAAAYAELTLQGISASEAETGIAAILTAAINPTEALTEAVQEYGFASSEALIQAEGLAGFLEFLSETAGGSSAQMSELTGNVRATNAALALTSDGASGFIARLGEMEGAAGRTGDVFATQMATLSASIDRAQAAIGNLSITVGATVAPAINVAADATAGWARVINLLPAELQTVAAGGTALAGSVALVSGGLLLAIPQIAQTITAFQRLRTAMIATGAASAALRLTPIGLALTAVAAAGGLVTKAWLDQKQAADDYNTSLSTLDETLERIRRRGDDALAQQGQSAKQLILDIEDASDAAQSFQEYMELIGETPAFPQSPEYAEQIAQWETYQATVGAVQVDSEMAAEAIAALNSVLNDTTVDADAFLAWALGMLEAADATETLVDDQEALNAIIAAAEEPPTEFLHAYSDALNENSAAINLNAESWASWESGRGPFDAAVQSNIITWEDFTASVEENIEASQDATETIDALGEAHQRAIAFIEAAAAAEREFVASIRELGGFADPLSTINLAGMGSDASFLAEQMQVAGTAFDNVFRVIVGNTNAIIGQADATQSWADELINVRGELGLIDELLAGGFIDRNQYDAAQDAYDSISVSTENIRNNLQAVQAIQAPFVAENLEVVRAYTAQLRLMDEETQRTTLAFMDLQTVQEAQEIITLGNTEAFRNMGPAGREAFEAMIVGATTANPLLLDVLESMGAITRTADGGFEINWDSIAEGGSAIQQLTDSVEDLVSTLREIYGLPPLEVEVATSITGPLAGSDGLGLLAGGTNALLEHLGIPDRVEVPITPTIEGASGVGDGTGGAGNFRDMLGIPDTVDVVVNAVLSTFGGLGGIAGGAVASFADALGIPDQVDVPVAVTGDDKLATVQDTIASLPESTTVSVVIDVDDSELEGLGAFGIYSGGNEGGGAAALPEYRIPVSINVTGTDELAAVAETLVVLNLAETTPSVNVDTSGFVSGFDLVKDHIADLDDDEPTVSIDGAPGLWAVQYDIVKSQIADLDDDVATVTINAENNASAVIGLVGGSLSLLDGRTATTYVDTVQRTFVQTVGRPAGVRHGGIPSFASGGMVPFWAGENGLEVAYFATGGTALLPHEGMYAAPPMTYISPSNANPSTTYGGDVNITIQHYGGGADEFDRMVESRLVPAVERAVTRSNRAMGVH